MGTQQGDAAACLHLVVVDTAAGTVEDTAGNQGRHRGPAGTVGRKGPDHPAANSAAEGTCLPAVGMHLQVKHTHIPVVLSMLRVLRCFNIQTSPLRVSDPTPPYLPQGERWASCNSLLEVWPSAQPCFCDRGETKIEPLHEGLEPNQPSTSRIQSQGCVLSNQCLHS